MVARKTAVDQPDDDNNEAGIPDNDSLISISSHAFTDEQLREIGSMEDALAIIGGESELVNAAEFIGDGYAALGKDEKQRLCGVAFLIMKWAMVPGEKSDTGKPFSVLWVLTKSREKLRFTDGSTGVHDQLCEIFDRNEGRVTPMYVPGGLRLSEYDYTDDDGKTSRARTFYLNV